MNISPYQLELFAYPVYSQVKKCIQHKKLNTFEQKWKKWAHLLRFFPDLQILLLSECLQPYIDVSDTQSSSNIHSKENFLWLDLFFKHTTLTSYQDSILASDLQRILLKNQYELMFYLKHQLKFNKETNTILGISILEPIQKITYTHENENLIHDFFQQTDFDFSSSFQHLFSKSLFFIKPKSLTSSFGHNYLLRSQHTSIQSVYKYFKLPNFYTTSFWEIIVTEASATFFHILTSQCQKQNSLNSEKLHFFFSNRQKQINPETVVFLMSQHYDKKTFFHVYEKKYGYNLLKIPLEKTQNLFQIHQPSIQTALLDGFYQYRDTVLFKTKIKNLITSSYQQQTEHLSPFYPTSEIKRKI